jgi:uncharacterized protein (TIGR03437 family)
MGKARKVELDDRLEAHFATLRSLPLTEKLKRSLANWPIYAAVSGSAMAMVTGASASIISSIQIAPARGASVRIAQPGSAGSKGPPIPIGAILGLDRQTGHRSLKRAVAGASQTQTPSINAGGVVPVAGTENIIQPGEWVSIYGENLANKTASWNGDFPTSLGGTSVKIDGKAAYLSYVSPTQINLQAPSDTARGTVAVVVTTAAGSATSSVTLSSFAPSFSLLYKNYVTGIIIRSDRSGAYDGGIYDILGPTGNSFGYATVAAQPGDVVELFAFGFGPTTPDVPAGKPFSGAAPLKNQFGLYIDKVQVTPMFVGLSSAGLYQINFVVPQGLGEGDVHIHAEVGAMRTQKGVLFSLQTSAIVASTFGASSGFFGGIGIGSGFISGSGGGTSAGPPGGTNAPGGGTGGGSGGGTGGGSGGGTGGGSGALRKAPYLPRLRFPQNRENT